MAVEFIKLKMCSGNPLALWGTPSILRGSLGQGVSLILQRDNW